MSRGRPSLGWLPWACWSALPCSCWPRLPRPQSKPCFLSMPPEGRKPRAKEGHLMFTHKIPNHLETEDLFLFGLTVRQCLLLFVGAGLSDLLFTTTFGLFPHPTTAVLILCLVVAGVCMLLVVAI